MQLRSLKGAFPGTTNDKIILIASSALVLSGLMQLATAWLQYAARRDASSCSPDENRPLTGKQSPTWIDDDFPNSLEIDLGPPVALTLEDSFHYTLSGEDADAEWESVYPGDSAGFLRLGPNRRFFGLSMYHQIHCLDSLRFAILGREHPARRSWESVGRRDRKREVPHAQHCLNYLRQTILCAADLTLEPEDKLGSLDVGEGLFATHVCRDWSKVDAFVARNFEEYKEWVESNRSRSS